MKFIAYPKLGSPYCICLSRALEAGGAQVLDGHWSLGWLRAHAQRGDVVHLHWPSFLYGSSGPAAAVAWRFLKYLALLGWLHLRGVRLWWTAHNLLPHERSRWPVLDVWARQATIRLADTVFVHGEHAGRVLLERFPGAAGKCQVISHGNWIGHYQRAPARHAARERLGLPQQAFVYLFLGQCRPYKNLDALIRAFRRLEGDHLRLVIAGAFSDAGYRDGILALAAGDGRIRIEPRFVGDDELPVFLGASDVMCIPYREILTSGSAMLALSFGRPVISIDRGFLKDVVTEGTGILIPAGDEGALQEALARACQASWSEGRILAQAERHTFAGAARVFLDQALGC